MTLEELCVLHFFQGFGVILKKLRHASQPSLS
jgi:hypothetical protein